MTTADRLIFVLKILAALGCGLMAGVFFAFSSFVMGALARLPHAQGLAAMQLINIRVLNPVFVGVFMGTALACLALGISSLLNRQQLGAVLVLAGSLLYPWAPSESQPPRTCRSTMLWQPSSPATRTALRRGPATSRAGRPGIMCARSRLWRLRPC